jgi:outer membrane protein
MRAIIKRRFTYAIQFLLVIGLLSPLYGQDSLRSLTLDESVQTGLTNSTVALKAKNAIDISGAQVLGSYGQFLPDLSIGSGYAYTSGTTLTSVTAPILVTSTRNNLTYQVTTNLNIFNGFSDYAAFKASKLYKEVAELSLARAKQFIVLDITQSYLQIILDKQIVSFAQQNFQTSLKREAQLNELVTVGRRAQSDLYQQQAQTSTDQQFLTNTENKLRNDKILLLQKLRIDAAGTHEFNDPIVDESPLGTDYADEKKLIEKALSQRVDLQSSRYAREAAVWYIKKYRSGYLPKVFLSAGAYGVAADYSRLLVNHAQQNTDLRPIGTQLYNQVYGVVALNASWTIFDKYYTKSNVAIARITAYNAQIDYENVNLQIIAETRQAYGNYKAALQQIETSEKGLIAAQKAYETLDSRYSLGSANFIEVANAQNNLLQAKQNRAQNAINLFLQKKTLDYYVGN